MKASGKADIYARAAFDLATLADTVDETDEGLRTLVASIGGHADLRETLADQAIEPERKRAILRDIFADAASAEAIAIASLAVERGDADVLVDIARRFAEIAEAERGMVVAEVTTAVPLDDSLRARLAEKLSASLDRPVTLRERVDEAILGGIVINVAGRVLDGSLALQLDGARARLSSTAGGES